MIKKTITITLRKKIVDELSGIQKFLSGKLTDGESVEIGSIVNKLANIKFYCNNGVMCKEGFGLAENIPVNITVNCSDDVVADSICKYMLENYGSTNDLILEEIKNLRADNETMRKALLDGTITLLDSFKNLMEQNRLLYEEKESLKEENNMQSDVIRTHYYVEKALLKFVRRMASNDRNLFQDYDLANSIDFAENTLEELNKKYGIGKKKH